MYVSLEIALKLFDLGKKLTSTFPLAASCKRFGEAGTQNFKISLCNLCGVCNK